MRKAVDWSFFGAVMLLGVCTFGCSAGGLIVLGVLAFLFAPRGDG